MSCGSVDDCCFDVEMVSLTVNTATRASGNAVSCDAIGYNGFAFGHWEVGGTAPACALLMHMSCDEYLFGQRRRRRCLISFQRYLTLAALY